MHAGRIARQYAKLFTHLVICTWDMYYYYSHSTDKETEVETGYVTCSRSHGWSRGSAKFEHWWPGSRAVLRTPGLDLSPSNTPGLPRVTAGFSWHCFGPPPPLPTQLSVWCPQHHPPLALPPAGPASLHVCSPAAWRLRGREARPAPSPFNLRAERRGWLVTSCRQKHGGSEEWGD